MKNIGELKDDLAEALDLPGELIPGASKLWVTAGRRLLVENHRGVLKYENDCISVNLSRGKLMISGTGLKLKAMNHGQLLIIGKIKSVEWE